MLVAFDVGNTTINVGVYDKQNRSWKHWRIRSDAKKTYDEYGIILAQLFERNNINISKIEGIILSTVVPEITYNLERGIRKYLKLEPIIVTTELDLGFKINYDNPKQLSSDVICNMVAVNEFYGGPVIVVDVGTATTISALNKNGEFIGQTILSGMKIMFDGLIERTSKYSRVIVEKPQNVISTNNSDAINGGIIYGYAFMLDGLIDRFKKEMGEESVMVIGTGGLIQAISDELTSINEIYDYLTLEGLRVLYDKNS